MDSKLVTVAFCVTLYTAAIIAIGLFKSRETRSQPADYFLAGRSLNAWLAAFSGAASAESGWVLLGLIGIAYTDGISCLWLLPGCLAGYLFNWLVIAPSLRRIAAEKDAVTVPQVLARRYPEDQKMLQSLAAIIILTFMIAYVAAQLTAVGKALDAMFGLPYIVGVMIGLCTVFAYVISGGFRASVWTDLVQAALMVATLVILPIYAFVGFDGSVTQALGGVERLFDWTAGNTGFGAIGFVLGWVGIGLAYPGQPHVVVRFMATRDDQQLRRGAVIAAVWSTLVFAGAIATGLLIRAWTPHLTDPEEALPIFAITTLPSPIAGLILAAVIAAICSTADSQLLIATSTVSEDLFNDQAIWKRLTRKSMLVVLGIAAALLAASESRVIFEFVLYAWGVLGATIGTALIISLLQPRSSGKGVVIAMAVGLVTVVVWSNVEALSSRLYALIPGFVISLAVGWFAFRTVPTDTLKPENEQMSPSARLRLNQ